MAKILVIWVEGGSDARFFDLVIKPFFKQAYKRVEVRTYANLKRVKFEKMLQGLRSINVDCLVVADMDREKCVTAKKEVIGARIRNIEPERIRVVIEEIESWYLAGLDENAAHSLNLPLFQKTDAITKEQFVAMMPRSFDSRIDFMMEILKVFSPAVAVEKNTSFNYFFAKHNFDIAKSASGPQLKLATSDNR